MERSVEDIGAKMDALGLWEAIAPYNWAIKPTGTVFPYFCTVIVCDKDAPARIRFLMLEGWQTLHDYVRTRIDRNFGFYSSPAEMPHLELVFPREGACRLFRYDTGYFPQEADARQRAFAAKMLWEAFGVMLRMESDRELPMKYSGERAVFARVEARDGTWADAPLPIPDPPPHVEKVSFRTEDVKKAQDLPMAQGEAISVDFRLCEGVSTREPRPRAVYELVAVDSASGESVVRLQVTIPADGGLRGLWESMPPQVLKALIRRGRIPGELRFASGRVFRMMRPLAEEIPFKLSLHDSLPELG